MSVFSIAIAARYVRCGGEGGLVIFEIRARAQTDSTNDDAAPLLGAPEHAGAVLLADFQRRGRGRHARAWIAPPGTSLLFTTILPASLSSAALWAVPFWTGLCVADGIEAATGLRVELQWPNDLLLRGRKTAGILCVSRVVGERAFVGCGTGINVVRPESDRELDAIVPPPAFIGDLAPEAERETILHAILAAYERRLAELETPFAVARAWERRAELAETPYRLTLDGSAAAFEARALRLADDGGLVVRDTNGDERTVGLADARVMRS
ncbi:MAG: biotin--[acetyl-CoA-carboxylase] ligase [Vulcanimicrobiaceae bacterium]